MTEAKLQSALDAGMAAQARIEELEARAEDYPALFEKWSAVEAALRRLIAFVERETVEQRDEVVEAELQVARDALHADPGWKPQNRTIR
jgi:Arc/MetJ family transcription regulator